ncbi:hypothetical protein CVT25_001557 [Psilocybe cyanescens]|uniref:non-reducing end alpha-L-arabinofuranosidase n=1 Tax=Psilocybe cyanescens TaxID=93625 RepID=A0A409WPZ5_PSICY|nr:hypothetical protein CVT25_001557 [Psilocybe cyanescens]
MWNPKCTALLMLALVKTAIGVTVSVSATASHPIPTTLYIAFFKGDKCLKISVVEMVDYMENCFKIVLSNWSHQASSSAALTAWAAVNGAGISVIKESVPVSSALPNALHVTIPTGKTGQVGFSNSGYNNGIKVTSGSTYTASFYYRFPTSSSFSGNAVIALQSTSGQIYGSTTVTLSGSQTSWKQVTVTFTPTSSPSSLNNLFSITLDGAAASGQSINFAMMSLFPPTFKNRPNGMRLDIANALANMGPGFFRLPGGNNLEGGSAATRWQWNATVGPLVSRPGRMGDWGYVNTDGLGLLDYLNWCEDLNMEPIMAVWAGYSLDGSSVAAGNLQPYVQQAIDQINFVVGSPTSSAPAALRSSLGHPAPFKLNYVEIGNEVSLTHRTFLQLTHFLATTYTSTSLSPSPNFYDVHVYNTPTWFAQNAFYYDTIARDGRKYFEGEYAAISTNSGNLYGTPAQGRLTYPTMQSAAGEAAFMTGLERNSDIVFAASYAPLLGHITANQWTPNLLAFDAGSVYLSTSYHVQKLFSANRGDNYISSTLPSKTGTLFWSIAEKTSTNQLIIKISNTAANADTVTFSLPFSNVASTGTLQLLTGSATGSNTPSNPNLFAPVTSTISTGKTFTYNPPAVSVSVITISLSGSTAPVTTTSTSPTTTTTTTPTTTAGGAIQTQYGQCGGTGYTGPTACASPYKCTYSNEYYSQCL